MLKCASPIENVCIQDAKLSIYIASLPTCFGHFNFIPHSLCLLTWKDCCTLLKKNTKILQSFSFSQKLPNYQEKLYFKFQKHLSIATSNHQTFTKQQCSEISFLKDIFFDLLLLKIWQAKKVICLISHFLICWGGKKNFCFSAKTFWAVFFFIELEG